MNISRQSTLVLAIVLGCVIGIMANVSRSGNSSGVEPNAPQDVNSLDRRISLLEQRFYSVESNISRVQQYLAAQRPPVSQSSANDRELIMMREEIQRLSLRVAEIECGLVKLDERTTTSSRKTAAAKSTDPCRLNPETPVRLSTHP